MRALKLLGRFLDMGSWAVDLALSVGIFPYVLKLLQTTAADLRSTLVFIWTKILALDKSCQVWVQRILAPSWRSLIQDSTRVNEARTAIPAPIDATLHETSIAMLCNVLSQVDLVKDGGQQYFVQQLGAEDSSITPESRAQSAFVLAVICDGHPRGQALCADAQLLAVALAHLQGARAAAAAPGPSRSAATLLLKWLCLAIGKLCEDMPEVRTS